MDNFFSMKNLESRYISVSKTNEIIIKCSRGSESYNDVSFIKIIIRISLSARRIPELIFAGTGLMGSSGGANLAAKSVIV